MSDREPVSETTRSANSRMVNSFGLPMLRGPVSPLGIHQTPDAFDQVRHITERTCLLSVAIERDRLIAECLHNKVAHYAAVIDCHARTIGVEDPYDEIGRA